MSVAGAFPAASVQSVPTLITFVASSTSAVGVYVAVYTFASDVTVKSERAPFATVTSSAVKAVGSSEKVKVIVEVSPAFKAVSER